MTDETTSSPVKTVSFLRVGKRRLEIFQKACVKFGLTVVDHTAQDAVVLIDDELDFLSASKAVKNSTNSTPTFIRTQWLSDSIKQNRLLPYRSYVLQTAPCPIPSSITETSERIHLKRERAHSSSVSDTDDEPSSKKVDNSIEMVLRTCLTLLPLEPTRYSTNSAR